MDLGIYTYKTTEQMKKIAEVDLDLYEKLDREFHRVSNNLAGLFVSEYWGDEFDELYRVWGERVHEEAIPIQDVGKLAMEDMKELDDRVHEFWSDIAAEERVDPNGPVIADVIANRFMRLIESEVIKGVYREVIRLQKELWEKRFGDRYSQ